MHAADQGIAGAKPGETVSVYDDLGVNLDLDGDRRLIGMEILEGRAIAARLESDSSV
jgi:hypothetical protein